MATEKSLNQISGGEAAPTNVRSPETPSPAKQEQAFEQPKPAIESGVQAEGKSTVERTVAPSAAAPILPPVVDQQVEIRRKKIESILSDNLAEAYQALTPEQQLKFKTVGEKTAVQINALLSETKIKVEKIINLIKFWLSYLPGINKFFLEKEAKIKTDAIIQLKKGGEQ
jgi:hypothetical protein